MRVPIDNAEAVFQRVMRDPATRDLWKEQVRGMRESLFQALGQGLDGRDAAAALNCYLRYLEGRIALILPRHSRLFWLLLARGLRPTSVGQDSPAATGRAWLTLQLALAKYGGPVLDVSLEPDPAEAEGGLGQLLSLSSFEREDVADLLVADAYCRELVRAAGVYARVTRGARLLRRGEGYAAIGTDQFERLMQLYYRRNQSFWDLPSPFGTIVDLAMPEPDEITVDTVVLPAYNYSRHQLPSELLADHGLDPTEITSFLPLVMPLKDLRRVFQIFGPELQSRWGVSPNEMLGLLVGRFGAAGGRAASSWAGMGASLL